MPARRLSPRPRSTGAITRCISSISPNGGNSPAESDVFALSRLLRALQRGMNAIRNEVKRRSALHGEGRTSMDVRRLLDARGQKRAAHFLGSVPFRMVAATNSNCDEFSVLIALSVRSLGGGSIPWGVASRPALQD